MKKTFLVIVMAVFCSIAMVQSSYAVSAGGWLGYQTNSWTMSNSDEVTMSNGNMGLGAFVDATYLRAGLGYTFVVGKTEMSNGSSVKFDLSYSYLNLYALGKYPIALGSITLWPAVGLGYDINLTAKDEDDKDIEDTKMSDLFILGGVGADIDVGKIFISPSFIFGYNLTPNQDKEDVSGVNYSGYKLVFSIGVGMKF